MSHLFCRRHCSLDTSLFVFRLSSLGAPQLSSRVLFAHQHQGSYGLRTARFQHARNSECVTISFTRHRQFLSTSKLSEEAPMFLEDQRVSRGFELCSPFLETSSRISCSQCRELNFDSSNETYDQLFVHCSKVLSDNDTDVGCNSSSPNCSHTCFSITCASAPASKSQVASTIYCTLN